eukprot:TRINITY_DN1716_c0_g1_i1.p1 TRINITY_DN1716_c0_g1~~TRINITY_DN1716_c0_g1_i1.p1  ORF type:complete len:492 (+),score=46.41 TRINITY_DN1716_c0_g1_i1:147-1622(+)
MTVSKSRGESSFVHLLGRSHVFRRKPLAAIVAFAIGLGILSGPLCQSVPFLPKKSLMPPAIPANLQRFGSNTGDRSVLGQIDRKKAAAAQEALPERFPLSREDRGPFARLHHAQEQRSLLMIQGNIPREKLAIFAQQMPRSGDTGAYFRYYVDTYEGFANRCAPPYEGGSHFYEMFEEGRPCWPYFDMEFMKDEHPDLNGQEVMIAFRRVFQRFCRESLEFELDLSRMLEMDSTTDVKFSRHVVIKAEGFAFRSNKHFGKLVNKFVEYAKSDKVDADSQRLLFPNGGSVIDLNVYNSQRAFRVLFHSKLGKDAKLKLVDTRSEVIKPTDSQAQQLYSSLASNVPVDAILFDHPSLAQVQKVHRIFNGEVREMETYSGSTWLPVNDDVSLQPLIKGILQWWDKQRRWTGKESGGQAARLQKIHRAAEEPHKLCISIVGNRYCLRHGRSHKSNGVYFILDTKEGWIRQYCHDVDCKGTQRETWSIAEDVLPHS